MTKAHGQFSTLKCVLAEVNNVKCFVLWNAVKCVWIYMTFGPSSLILQFLFSRHSSDVVWELKPKKKNRWKTLSTKETEMLENSFREYTESGPVDCGIVDLENNFQVRE